MTETAQTLQRDLTRHLRLSLAREEAFAHPHDLFTALALVCRDRLIERWLMTRRRTRDKKMRRVCYLSMEFLVGRTLGNAILSLDLADAAREALLPFGRSLEEIEELECDAGLGNGGLGRLAACFLDSMATLDLAAIGYGIRYEYGIFFQHIEDGRQVESPDNWLRSGNPWEIPRPDRLQPVHFYGRVERTMGPDGRAAYAWVDTDAVMAMAYDMLVPGHGTDTVNTLRLWAAKSTREFDFHHFNSGDYIHAVQDKNDSELISKVLYPNDNLHQGRELRLKQEYFFVSATLQDVLRRHKEDGQPLEELADRVALHLNDTHPAIAIAEWMRLLVDIEGMAWNDAWRLCKRAFAYTNHTLMPEALEKWPVELLGRVLPRHLQIIYDLNARFLTEVNGRFPNDGGLLQRVSLIEEGVERKVRMANLAVIGSHAVNGVSALHSDILQKQLFRDFARLEPGKFHNKTNGITPRRWLAQCNPGLAALISEAIGPGWMRDLDLLRGIAPLAEDPSFRERWRVHKRANKKRLADHLQASQHLELDIEALFDCQAKRMHEYKRQLLCILHLIVRYDRIRRGDARGLAALPRTVLMAGKAAPGYVAAKRIIELFHGVAAAIAREPETKGRLQAVFLPNYSVSLAEKLIPAADLSEQISTAGTEASGTGNMKFALNGALTIGTWDGANIEIAEQVGAENMFLFGLKTDEVTALRRQYQPDAVCRADPELMRCLALIAGGHFSPGEPDRFAAVVQALLSPGDPYVVLADFGAYAEAQVQAETVYRDPEEWTRRAILNVAHMGAFSSDATIRRYAVETWGVLPQPT